MQQPVFKRRLILGLFLIFFVWMYYIIVILTGAWGFRDSIIILILFSAATAVLIVRLVKEADPYPKLMKLLYDDCSPEAFLKETRTLLDKRIKKGSMKRNKLLICLCTGHYAAGRFQEALDELLKAVGKTPIKTSRAIAASFFHLLFLIYTELDKLDLAREALGRMIAAAHRLKGKTGRSFKLSFVEGIYLLRVSTGVYENADTVFLNSFKTARSNFERAMSAFMLGRIYEHFGQAKETKEMFEYVVEHGEKLHIAKLAAERLGLLETA